MGSPFFVLEGERFLRWCSVGNNWSKEAGSLFYNDCHSHRDTEERVKKWTDYGIHIKKLRN